MAVMGPEVCKKIILYNINVDTHENIFRIYQWGYIGKRKN